MATEARMGWAGIKPEDIIVEVNGENVIGLSMEDVANKVKGVRCALCNDPFAAKMTRLHNDANMLALGAGMIGKNMAIEILETFSRTG